MQNHRICRSKAVALPSQTPSLTELNYKKKRLNYIMSAHIGGYQAHYSVNGDEYLGQFKGRVKHGTIIRFNNFLIQEFIVFSESGHNLSSCFSLQSCRVLQHYIFEVSIHMRT